MSQTASLPQTAIPDNAHIDPDTLRAAFADQWTRLEEHFQSTLQLQPLGKQKQLDDSTTKLFLRTQAGQAAGVILCSRAAAPELVARGVELAEAVRQRVGPTLGQAIITPIMQGRVAGRSYAIYPRYREFSAHRPIRIAQRIALRRPLLHWLREANRQAAEVQPPGDQTTHTFAAALEHLARQRFLSELGDDVVRSLHRSLARLESGAWQPRHTFDHNDFWLGNVMLLPSPLQAARAKYPFVLIDWPGANPQGFGVYDLIRLARALKLSRRALQRELHAHAAALGCEPEDTQGHLLAALGRLHQHLEHFPEKKYVQVVQSCWKCVTVANGSTDQAHGQR